MSKKILLLSSAIACIIISSVLFISSHSTYIKYNDWWVLGNTVERIERRYGEFDLFEYRHGVSGKVAYYIYTDNSGFLPDHLKHYYYIEYNEQGIATRVYDACAPGG